MIPVRSAVFSALLCLSISIAAAHAAEVDMQVPKVRNPNFQNRTAIVLTSAPQAYSSVSAQMDQDVSAIPQRLLDFGFDVEVITGANRPELDRAVRDVSEKVPSGGELAVFILGRILSTDDELWIVPVDAPSDLESKPYALPTEGIRLSDALRRLSRRTPKTISVVVDECVPVGGNSDCAIDSMTRQVGTLSELGIIATKRVTKPSVDGKPLAGVASAGPAIITAMTKEGANLLEFYQALTKQLDGSNLATISSVSLSTSFMFRPSHYFETLPLKCNTVDPTATTERIKSSDLDPVAEDCRKDHEMWPYVGAFLKAQKVIAEQVALKAALASSCSQIGLALEFVRTYDSSRWRPDVDKFISDCEATARAAAEKERTAKAADVSAKIERMVQGGATTSDLRGAGLEALDVGAGLAAFRAFSEIDPRSDDVAAWQMGRFYDPTVNDKVLRETVPHPNPSRAVWYYSIWKNSNARYREAVDAVCKATADLQNQDPTFRRACQP